MDTTSTEITGTKKIVAIIAVSAVVVVSAAAAFLPEYRQTAVEIVKALLGTVTTMIK